MQMTPEQLQAILGDHGKWIRGEVDGKRANLTRANLDGANLYGANLYGANLYGANLDGANLYGANLYGANLYGASLYGANLTRANLDGANLTLASLYGANLTRANLTLASLYGANLTRANLDGASLDGANLTLANLDGANLYGANLTRANLEKAKVDDNTNLTGEPWKDYIEKVLPALLTAGGKTIEQIVATGCWTCHQWENCPMHEAFGINHASEGPLLLRPRIEQFVQLFDAGLIPCPVVASPPVVCPVGETAGEEKAAGDE